MVVGRMANGMLYWTQQDAFQLNVIGTYRSSVLNRANAAAGHRSPSSSSSSSATGGINAGTGLPPFIAIIVLVAGVVGGLILVISIIFFCKYCIHNSTTNTNTSSSNNYGKGFNRSTKRSRAMFPDRESDERIRGKYESLGLQSSTTVLVTTGPTTSATSTTSNNNNHATGFGQQLSMSSTLSSVKQTTSEQVEDDALVDIDNDIDFVVAQYKQSLVGLDEDRETTPSNDNAQDAQKEQQLCRPNHINNNNSNSSSTGAIYRWMGQAPPMLQGGPTGRGSCPPSTSDLLTAATGAAAGGGGVGLTAADRHVSFMVADKAGSFGGYGIETKTQRWIESELHHSKYSKSDRSSTPNQIAKQRSLGNLGTSSSRPVNTTDHPRTKQMVDNNNDPSVNESPDQLPVPMLTGNGPKPSPKTGRPLLHAQRQVAVEIHIDHSYQPDPALDSPDPLKSRRPSGAGKLTPEACYTILQDGCGGGSSIGGRRHSKDRRQSMSLEIVPPVEKRRSPLNTRRVKSYEENGPNPTAPSTVRATLAPPDTCCYGPDEAEMTASSQPRYNRNRRQSMSLEIVPPIEKRPSPLNTRRVKSYEDDRTTIARCRDYDRNKITQFIRHPTVTSEDPECTATGRRPDVRSRVRYNDTGSFEEVDEEKMELLLVNRTQTSSALTVYLEGIRGGDGGLSAGTPPNGMGANQQRYKDLWRLRATFEETEEFSDIVRMEEITSPEDPSSEERDLALTSLTTSFESTITEPRMMPTVLDQHKLPLVTDHKSPPVMPLEPKLPAAASMGTGLVVFPSQETRRQSYRRMITERMASRSLQLGSTGGGGCGSVVASRPAAAENSLDSLDTAETDGEVSDTSRQEMTTTSFDSTTTTTTTTTTTDNNTDVDNISRLHPMQRGPEESTIQPQQHPQMRGAAASGEALGSAALSVVDEETATSGGARVFERRTPKTASKKRRQYRNDRRVWQVCESINEVSGGGQGPQTSGWPKGEEDEEEGLPPSPMVTTSSTPAMTSFSRFLRYHIRRSGRYHMRRRDYSVDEKTDAVFNEFLRYDPNLDGRSRRTDSSPGGSEVGGRRHRTLGLETVVELSGGGGGSRRTSAASRGPSLGLGGSGYGSGETGCPSPRRILTPDEGEVFEGQGEALAKGEVGARERGGGGLFPCGASDIVTVKRLQSSVALQANNHGPPSCRMQTEPPTTTTIRIYNDDSY